MTTAPAEPNKKTRARKTGTATIKQKPKVRVTKRARAAGDNPGTGHWRIYFIEHLIQSSNITAAARVAKIDPSRAYRTRKQDPGFAAQWDAALVEGYKNLEMDLLAYLRNPAPDHKMDVASAIRLLTLHRQNIAQSRAQEDDRSEQEVLDSIDAMIDEMRNRAAANAALANDPESPDEQA